MKANFLIVLSVVLAPLVSMAGEDDDKAVKDFVNQGNPNQVFWGDTHLHTNLSVDILDIYNPMGKGLSRQDAYRFARGEAVVAHNGTTIQRERPLDFLVIADHAENIGLHQGIINSDQTLLGTPEGRELRARYEAAKGSPEELAALFRDIYKNHGLYGTIAGGEAFQRTVWDNVVENADENNEPGVFTAFIGYEYTSHDFNLHRVVMFRDDASVTRKFLPFSQFDSRYPEDLWDYLDRYETTTGGDVIAIPHNGNLSRGHMFMLEDKEGQQIDLAYAKSRNRWEPLYEVTQTKGDSETHPVLSPNDEFADYETWRSYYAMEPNEDEWRKYEYARSGLKLGLSEQARLGVNPFKVGLIGSTDAHSSLVAPEENRYGGSGPKAGPSPGRSTMVAYDRGSIVPGWRLNAAGYAAVWATDNTRAALFDAMKRREVYASTGPRITLRYFGGWDFESADALRPDLATVGYQKGVPMGGDLVNAPDGAAISLLIRAVRDTNGANLDRVQVVKGWLDKNGDLHEKVHNVALSDGRVADAAGNVPDVGSTVDVATASYTNEIGDPELATVWTDPDFDADELSFYYVRVLEIPTPRWPAYDALRYSLDPAELPADIKMTTQERVYSSPIWYSP
ncbi:MAG: DUF3604 domain-containing protein [Woeseia sp.]